VPMRGQQDTITRAVHAGWGEECRVNVRSTPHR
jgi:hypothetical protein